MIRAAAVGVGSLGRHHARILASTPGVVLVGVSDISPEQGRSIAKEYGTAYYDDPAGLIPLVDCVSVAVTTSNHYEVCRKFLEAGRHTLVEKPLASSLEEGRALVELARSTGTLLQVGHLERFNPAFLAVKPMIKQPKFFEAHRLSVFVPRSLDVDVVLDLMIHDIDLVLSLTGSPVKEIRAAGIPILTDKIDIANVRLEFEDGSVANLTASRVSVEKIRKIRFFQRDDYISLDLARQTVSVYSLHAADTPLGREIISRNILVEQGEPLRNEINDFLDCVKTGRRPACAGQDGLAALAVAHQILAALERNLQ